MKKMIALILALALILSLSISVSAEASVVSPSYYIYLEDSGYEVTQVGLYYQPAECKDDVIPEGSTTDQEVVEYISNNWKLVILEPMAVSGREKLYGVFLLQELENLAGNFLVVVSYTGENGVEDYYVTDLLNWFDGYNTLVINLEQGTTDKEKNGYISGEGAEYADNCFVFGTRGEAMTTGDVISVDLEWGGMEFVYTPEETIWNPDTHEYEPVVNEDGSSNAGWSVAEGSSNHIAITNHSNVAVEAVLEFASAEGKNINGYFRDSILSCDSAAEMAYNSPEKAPSDFTVFNIIRCEIDEETQGELGTITITIRHREA